MNDLVGICIGVIVMGIVWAFIIGLVHALWFNFRWHVLGWRPAILDKALVDKTVEKCAVSFVRQLAEHAEEQGGEMDEEDIEENREMMAENFRKVIELYIHEFSTK